MNAKDSGVAQVRSRAGVARLEGNLALYLLPAGESPEVLWGILSGHRDHREDMQWIYSPAP